MTTVESCIFCEQPSGSREHAWPDWICRYVTDGKADWMVARQRVGSPVYAVENAGWEIDVVVTCVCDDCNHGWMGQLESRVSEFLKPMIDGQPTVLTRGQQKGLARWAAKTAIVMEYAPEETRKTPHAAASFLRTNLAPPERTVVLLARYEGQELLSYTRVVQAKHLGGADLQGDPHVLFFTTLVIGKVLLHVSADPWGHHPRPALHHVAGDHFVPLLEGDTRKVQWPPRLVVDDTSYNFLRMGPDPTTRGPVV